MLEAWEYEMFNSIDSGTLVRLVILLGSALRPQN
jgi:hypothetical protein